MVTDNDLCHTGKMFQDKGKGLDFPHLTNSPHHHLSDGLAEKYVGIAKNLMTKSCETG